LTQDEKTQVTNFLSLRKSIHDGPLYTVLGESSRVGKNDGRANTAAARFDPFEGMPRYSLRYTRKKRRIPKLDTRPYVLKYFPKELWSTLDPSYTTTNGSDSITQPKTSVASKSKKLNDINVNDLDFSGEGPVNGAQDAEDDDDPIEKGDEDDIPPEEELDDEYASDEDEMAGDYNAEQYFDDGGDDAGDDYDAGEADGGEYD
jgi:DNA-directed RNA polymerase III subunit RPC7